MTYITFPLSKELLSFLSRQVDWQYFLSEKVLISSLLKDSLQGKEFYAGGFFSLSTLNVSLHLITDIFSEEKPDIIFSFFLCP